MHFGVALLPIQPVLSTRRASPVHFPYQSGSIGKEQAHAGSMEMPPRHKILLLDDDQDLLEVYREILGRLPSKPEIYTATSGARALAMLASEPFSLLLCDLKMPKMDGLQVLTIVRRKFPQLRTAVLTCILDEQFRARAYSMGIDLFLEKPNSSKEITFLLECIESLLDREHETGFRGVQSKSLVDIIQLECLSQSSSVLKIIHGSSEGRVWIQNGEIIDAASENLLGPEAFQRILSWKSGNFEMLPDEPGRERRIFSSYQGLLLETAQLLDEAEHEATVSEQRTSDETKPAATSALAALSHFHGVEFVLTVSASDPAQYQAWGLENPEQVAAWTSDVTRAFRELGETLQAGMLNRVEGRGPMQSLAVASRNETELCVGFYRSLPCEAVRDTMQKIVSKWAS
jgi:CheY-like chemotaxis protein